MSACVMDVSGVHILHISLTQPLHYKGNKTSQEFPHVHSNTDYVE